MKTTFEVQFVDEPGSIFDFIGEIQYDPCAVWVWNTSWCAFGSHFDQIDLCGISVSAELGNTEGPVSWCAELL